MINHPEHNEQVKFFLMLAQLDYEPADLTFAVPNGAKVISKQHAVRLKQEGMKAGVPDILCLVASGSAIGLAIEMKIPPNKSSQNQKLWQENLRNNRWVVTESHSAEEAFNTWAEYTHLPPGEYIRIKRMFT